MLNFKKWSLKLKVLVLTEVVLLSLAAVSVFQVYNLEKTQKFMSSKNLQSVAINVGTPIGKLFRLKYNQIQTLASNHVFETGDREKIQNVLNKFAELNDGYTVLIYADKDGNFVASNTMASSGDEINSEGFKANSFSGQVWFEKSIKEEFSDDEDKLLLGTYVEAFLEDKIKKDAGLEKIMGSGFSTVVKDSNGESIGVVTARIRPSWIEDGFVEMYNSLSRDGLKSARLLIVDKNGKIVLDFEPSENEGSFELDYSKAGKELEAEYAQAFEGIKEGNASFFEVTDKNGVDRVVGYSSLIYDVLQDMGWGVVVTADSGELLGQLKNSIFLFYIAVLGILIASMVVVWFVVDKISNSLILVMQSLKARVDISMDTSKNLSHVSDELAAGSTEQAAAVQETVASMTEMTSMINQTALHVEESESLAMEVNHRTQKGSEIMQNMVSSMETIQQANEELHEMKQIIEEIADKTKVINDIVFKTQLLSFNASIEAARAGQHGRGFAVVAEEVGNLAQMSGNAANEIAALLSKSQSQVEQIVENTKVRVSEGQSVSGQAMETFNEIAEEIELITSKVKSIQDATREQEEGVKQVSITMRQIDETTQANSNLATSASNHAVGVKQEAEELEKIMKDMTGVVMGGGVAAPIKKVKKKRAKKVVSDDSFEDMDSNDESKEVVGRFVEHIKHHDEEEFEISEIDLHDDIEDLEDELVVDIDEISADDDSFGSAV
ncbi:MAG: methyl-accepting chemotaxis protein [Bdellovibrionota bacterium]|nr:methyl-accepting chemotaxis protein [Bdellovibrionota bacterium]